MTTRLNYCRLIVTDTRRTLLTVHVVQTQQQHSWDSRTCDWRKETVALTLGSHQSVRSFSYWGHWETAVSTGPDRSASLTFTPQDGMLRVRADVGIQEQTVILQSAGEASPWKQAQCGHTVRGRRR